MYLGSSISSNENDISMRLAKAWTAINRLSIIWKSNVSDEIKHNFFQVVVVSVEWEPYWTNPGSNTSWNHCCTDTYLENHLNKTDKACGTLLEKQEQNHQWFSPIDTITWMYKCLMIKKNKPKTSWYGHRMQTRKTAENDGW